MALLDIQQRSNLGSVYDRVQSENYKGRLTQMCKVLSPVLKSAPETLCLGPFFRISTSKNQCLSIETLIHDLPSPIIPDDTYKQIFIIARGEDGEIAGDRHTYLKAKDGAIFAQGGIATSKRGQGVSVPLDLVNTLFLQDEANNTHKMVVWQVANSNIFGLNAIKQGLVPDYDDPAYVSAKIAEQDHWQRVWGERGLMGLFSSASGLPNFYERTFFPQDPVYFNGLMSAGIVDLTRQDHLEDHRMLAGVNVSSIEPRQDISPASHHDKLMHVLRNINLRQA